MNFKYMKTESPHLLLAVDLGGSGTKIVGSLQGSDEVKVSLMMPHCVDVKDPNDLLFDLDFTEDNTWVKINGIGYAFGNLAAIKYNATNKLKPPKFTTAAPKICAAIAVFAQLFRLPVKFNLSLTFVLPPTEWEHKIIVIDRLQAALKDLDTPRGKLKIKLVLINTQPEGMGILLGQQIDLKSIIDTVTVIMLGYRNASVLSSTRGVVARPITCDLGFSDLLKIITSKTGYKTDDIIVPVFKYSQHKKYIATVSDNLIDVTMRLQKYNHSTYASDRQIASDYEQQITDAKNQLSLALNPILKCSGKDKQMELDHLIKSIDSANNEYWAKLTDWLEESMPNHSSYICLSGGTANYFKMELESYAKTKMDYNENRLRWHTKVEAPQGLGVSDDRFDDIYALWSELSKKYQPVLAD